MNRLAILLALALAAGLVAAPGCGSGPYTGKPEKLKKPRAKKRPAGDKVASEVTEEAKPTEMSNEQCRTNFFGEPYRSKRYKSESKGMANQADQSLVAAERQFGTARQQLVVEAIGTLSNALRKDPYGPEATYKLSVAYALLGKKSCTMALLERLKSLQTLPDVEKEATRVIQRAARDPAFGAFSKEARTVLGE